MKRSRLFVLLCVSCGPHAVACSTSLDTALPAGQSAELTAPDGIDPRNPNIERSTLTLDLQNVRTIRVELPVGRVTAVQTGTVASLRATKVVVRPFFGAEGLRPWLTNSTVTARRSLADSSRLDILATPAADLAGSDSV